jgi:hypothetical protein
MAISPIEERCTAGAKKRPMLLSPQAYLAYFTSNGKLSEWLLNSGAYMH